MAIKNQANAWHFLKKYVPKLRNKSNQLFAANAVRAVIIITQIGTDFLNCRTIHVYFSIFSKSLSKYSLKEYIEVKLGLPDKNLPKHVSF